MYALAMTNKAELTQMQWPKCPVGITTEWSVSAQCSADDGGAVWAKGVSRSRGFADGSFTSTMILR